MKWIFGTASSKEPVIVDARTGKVVSRWSSDDSATARGAVWFDDILVETDESRAAIWKPGAKEPHLEKSSSAAYILKAPAGDRFLAANAMWTIGGALLFRLASGEGCEVGHWSADGLYLSGYCNEGIVVWDAVTGKVVSRLIAQTTFRHDMAWSRDGHQLLMQNEARQLLRHSPLGMTVLITPRVEDGQVAFSTTELTDADDGQVRKFELPAPPLNGWNPP